MAVVKIRIRTIWYGPSKIGKSKNNAWKNAPIHADVTENVDEIPPTGLVYEGVCGRMIRLTMVVALSP